ncbi:MAG TPA: hypothetical protein VGG72_06580 [Bryobacteraceae bacterium]
MRYRVTFMERTGRAGNPSETPPNYLEIEMAPGIVRDKTFVERDQPIAMHNEETLEEDDDFLSVGSEVWDYDIAGGREKEFLEAVQNTQMAIECVPIDDGDLG